MKVLCFGVPLRGHINPMLPLMRELCARGADVVCVGDAHFRDDIEATGAHFVALGFELDSLASTDLLSLGATWLACLQARLPVLEALADRLAPDVVVNDFMCLWGRTVARRLDLPRVTLWPGFALSRGVLPPGWAITLSQLVCGGPGAWRRFRRRAHLATDVLGGARLRPADLITGADDAHRHLVFTWPRLQPRREVFDPRWHFVGPPLPREERLADTDLALLADLRGHRSALVSLGTVFHDNPGFFTRCIDGLADLADRLVVSLGGQGEAARQAVERALEARLGPRVVVRDWTPQLAVLQHASLFVSHGGMNSVHEALFHRVPLVVHPQGADQFTVAHRLQRCGLARWLRNPWFSASRLRSLARDALDDTEMKRRVAALCPAHGNAAQRAADVVVDLVKPTAPPARALRPRPGANRHRAVSTAAAARTSPALQGR